MIYYSFNFIVLFPLIFFLYYAIPARYGKIALSLDKKGRSPQLDRDLNLLCANKN